MSKEQGFIDRYEELLNSEWGKRYKEWLTNTLNFHDDADEEYDADEEIQESFIGAEVDRLVMLVAGTGEVGEYAVKCLEKWNIEHMNKADGIIWLLESIDQDRKRGEEGRLVLRWE